jgi:hypothetical protein
MVVVALTGGRQTAMKSANRVAPKEWSVVIRFLHEGGGILTLVEDYVPADREFFLFPTYDATCIGSCGSRLSGDRRR